MVQSASDGVIAASPAVVVPRRVLVAVVPGAAGQRIQAWREQHDPRRARLLPPHLTLCYRPPDVACELIEAQVRHAFPRPVTIRIGGVDELANRDKTLVVRVVEAADLDRARERLFDGTYVQMGGHRSWPWHITWIRFGLTRDRDAMLALARPALTFDQPWQIDRVTYLELRQGRYEAIAEWEVPLAGYRSV